MGSKTSRDSSKTGNRNGDDVPPHFDILLIGYPVQGPEESSLGKAWKEHIGGVAVEGDPLETFTGSIETTDGIKVNITCRVRQQYGPEGVSTPLYRDNHVNVVVYNTAELGAGNLLDRAFNEISTQSRHNGIVVAIGTRWDECSSGDEMLRADEAARKYDGIQFAVSCKTGYNIETSLLEIVTKAERTFV